MKLGKLYLSKICMNVLVDVDVDVELLFLFFLFFLLFYFYPSSFVSIINFDTRNEHDTTFMDLS